MKNRKGKSSKAWVLFVLALASGLFYFFSERTVVAPLEFPTNAPTSSPPATQVNPYLQQLALAYDSAFRTLMKKHNAPGAAVAIVHDSTVILLHGYGVKDIEKTDSINTHTVFRLASVSKPFASFLAAILVEEGLLEWNHTVIQHWPEFSLQSPEQTKQITLRHVLSHTTGLPYHTYTNMIEERLPADTLLSYLRDIRLVSQPGQMYSYQNVGYSIIGKVIERATGKPYQEVLKEKVFVPLNMTDASTDYIGLLGSGNMAQPHIFKRGKLRPTIVNDTYYNVSPAGGVNASISDMSKWLVALLGNKQNVISQQMLDTLATPAVLANSRNRNFYKWSRVRQAYYGLGWRVLRFTADTLVYHGGYVAGYRSEVAFHPSERIAICVLSNAPGPLADNSLPLFFEIFDRYRLRINSWRPKSVELL
jgi:beta-lactamase class C